MRRYRGSVAQIGRDSLRVSRVLVVLPEQARTPDLPQDELALVQRGAEAARIALHIWFDPETVWLAEPSGRRGCSVIFPDAAIQAWLTLKALFGLPLRQIEPGERHWSE